MTKPATAPALVFGQLPRRRSNAANGNRGVYTPRSGHYSREDYLRDVKDLQRRFAAMRIGVDL